MSPQPKKGEGGGGAGSSVMEDLICDVNTIMDGNSAVLFHVILNNIMSSL